MKRAPLLVAAAAMLVAANAWVAIVALENRRAPSGGAIRLTERELRLPPLIGDSTAIFLDLKWRCVPLYRDEERSPDWLDQAKLQELGFDCTVPLASPHAREHYSAPRNAWVYLVLEYEGPAWKRTQSQPDHSRSFESRLFVVDGGKDPAILRAKYPDRTRYAIARGAVRLRFDDGSRLRENTPSGPRLSGWIETLTPSQVFVPAPASRLLQTFRRQRQENHDREPRFSATVSWGTLFEPSLGGVRLLPASPSQGAP